MRGGDPRIWRAFCWGIFQAMVARDWTGDEKDRLAAVIAQALKDREADFCIKLGDKVGVPMKAWIAVCWEECTRNRSIFYGTRPLG